ncbi:MAG TPA: ABC transporter substrate-binding protein, partial [Methylomirabilota bacterium]
AFRNLSPSLPIVVAAAGDLVGMGLAKTLAQPGGNITGSQILSTDLAAKRLQLFKELMPSCERFGLLHQAVQAEEAAYYVRLFAELQAAGREASLRIRSFAVTSDADFESAFAAMKRERLEALIVASNPFMFSHRQRLAELAARHQLPVMHEYAEYVAAGGLLAYGVKLGEFWRRAAHFVDRILRGSKPADLPIEQPKTLELVINLKTAKALGLTIPGSLLLRADQLIE